MSEFHVQVVRLGKIGKHPNADTLDITQVSGRYPVIAKSGTYSTGDLAVHVPPDSLVDTRLPWFSWLADKASHNHLFRVKFAKIRSIPSYGFLVPMGDIPDSSGFTEGQDVQAALGVTKYDPGPCYSQDGVVQGDHYSHPADGVVPKYDIEGLRRYEALFQPGEMVSVTEKIHGSNGRWAHIGGELLCGSRTRFRSGSVWSRMAEQYGLEKILSLEANQGKVLYGEVYGPGIQDLHYGLLEPAVLFFDLYDSKAGKWVDVDVFQAFCNTNNLPMAPELYRGPFNLEQFYKMAEGQTTIGGVHVREGIVIKPLVERWDSESGVGRVFLKLAGEGYLLRKGA